MLVRQAYGDFIRDIRGVCFKRESQSDKYACATGRFLNFFGFTYERRECHNLYADIFTQYFQPPVDGRRPIWVCFFLSVIRVGIKRAVYETV
jgi:hypothetical protein